MSDVFVFAYVVRRSRRQPRAQRARACVCVCACVFVCVCARVCGFGDAMAPRRIGLRSAGTSSAERRSEWHEGTTWLIKLPGVGCSDHLREKFASRWQQWFFLD